MLKRDRRLDFFNFFRRVKMYARLAGFFNDLTVIKAVQIFRNKLTYVAEKHQIAEIQKLLWIIISVLYLTEFR